MDTDHRPTTDPGIAPPRRAGRRPDPAKDVALLDAAVDVVAEVGYEAMTMDLVAARAGSTKSAMYRRWPSKAALTLDAIVRLQDDELRTAELPDTGTLRGDLIALTEHYAREEGRRKLRLLAGLASFLEHQPELVDAANAVIVEPWVDVCRLLVERAIGRGEAETADVETVARIIPSMTSYRLLVQRRAVDREFFVGLVDAVLLPATRLARPS